MIFIFNFFSSQGYAKWEFITKDKNYSSIKVVALWQINYCNNHK